jgi:poly-beta-1,6 N-acetyl-D-glucosamine export porin PgaA
MSRWLTVLLVVSAISSIAAQTREEAVKAAREGRLDEGISTLRSLIANGDTSSETAYDLALVLTWAKRPKEATDVFERIGAIDSPDFILMAITRAYWDQRRYADAERLARRGLKASPKNSDWVKLLGLIVGESAERSGDLYTALRYYSDAHLHLPDDPDLKKAAANVLTSLGAPYAAASILGQRDLGLEAQKASLMIRWAEQIVPRESEQRFIGTDAALAKLDELIVDASAVQPIDAGLLTRLRRDRVVALRDRERWAEAAAQAQALRITGDRLPPYVREAEADALLALRRPEEARIAYGEVIKADPQNRNAIMGRFYSEVEEENFHAAFATIDALAASQTPIVRLADTSAPNRDWLGDRAAAGVARNYAGMEAQAWSRLYPLAQQAPAVAHLQDSLGAVSAARGWPRRAAEEVEIAGSLDPYDLGIQVDLADSALRLGRYAEARSRADKLVQLYPENVTVQNLHRQINSFERFDFRSETHSYLERENNVSDSPGTSVDTINRIYSPPIAYHWRIVGGFDFSRAEPHEGIVDRYRIGGGIEWRIPSLMIEGTGWENVGTLHRSGAQLATRWTPTDHWNFTGDVQLFSSDTPLRAVMHGITANSAGGTAGYDWHESTGWIGDLHAFNFSDGNHRLAAGFRFAQRFVDRPHLKITARPEIYTSRNTARDAPYFNPSRDFSLLPAFDVAHVLWRRYERSFSQHINAAVGTYWQQGYGAGTIVITTYEQAYQVNPNTEVRYGATYARRIYDGGPVQSLSFSLSLARRF